MEVIRKELETGTMLIVGIKYEPYYEPYIVHGANSSYMLYKKKDENRLKTIRHNLPQGNFKLLGDSKQLTEEDLVGVMPKAMGQHYINHNSKSIIDRWCKTALEAFNSLKESLGIVDVNKYGEKPVFAYEFGEDGPTDAMLDSAQDDFDYKSIQWRQEQSKVRKHIVLFEAKK